MTLIIHDCTPYRSEAMDRSLLPFLIDVPIIVVLFLLWLTW
jgi:hypothetical protein